MSTKAGFYPASGKSRRRKERMVAGIAAIGLVMALAGVSRATEWVILPDPESPPQAILGAKTGISIVATITAYTSSPEETDDTPWITANGTMVRAGIVACPQWIPFGTRVQIGDEWYTCEDRMHPRFDDRFDIWMTSKEQAIHFGVQEVGVFIPGLLTPPVDKKTN